MNRCSWMGMMVMVVAGLAGCATMTPEECAVADWERIGELDARSGQGIDHFARRASDCDEAGHPADQAAWTRGWDVGITFYCTPSNGFREGIHGRRYDRICPGRLEQDFLGGYDIGWAIHRQHERIEQTTAEIRQLEGEIEALHDQRPRDREAIASRRDRLGKLGDRLDHDELELARLRGLAQGRGFPLSLQ